MFRFIAFVWNDDDATQKCAVARLQAQLDASEWSLVFQSSAGARVFCADARSRAPKAFHLANGRGVVVGTLFRTAKSSTGDFRLCEPNLSERESLRIEQTGGQYLVDAFWGSYVAVIASSVEKRISILCSPMPTIACLTTEHEGVQLFFSHMSDCAALGILRMSINWRFIARSMAKLTHPGETGLVEVRSLRGGECIEIAAGNLTTRMRWNALTVAHSDRIDSVAESIAMMRETTRDCVRALAACHESILVLLSGGLDSSILLACLHEMPNLRLAALNRHSSGTASDERRFARASAERARCELIELARDPSFDITEILSARPTEKPRLYLVDYGQARPQTVLARHRGHSAIFSGNGGDEVFFSGEGTLLATDYVSTHGVGGDLFEVALAAGRLDGRSVWSVLAHALRHGLYRERWDPRLGAERFGTLVAWDVVDKLIEAEERPWFWYSRRDYVPPGKQSQIFRLLGHSNNRCSPEFGECGDPEHVSPLLSQPLVELSLRIPTYVLSTGGWDRTIARRAFANDLPEEIFYRRWKGMQDGYTAEIFRRNLPFIREMMLDGELVKNGFLIRRKLESGLSGGPSTALRGMHMVSKYLSLEVWLRIWAQHGVTPRSTERLVRGATDFAGVEA